MSTAGCVQGHLRKLYGDAVLDNVNYPALKDGACRENPASQVDQGKR